MLCEFGKCVCAQVCAQVAQVMSDSEIPWTAAHKATTRQPYTWDSPGKNTGVICHLPFPSPGGSFQPGIKPASPASSALQADSLLLKLSEKPRTSLTGQVVDAKPW